MMDLYELGEALAWLHRSAAASEKQAGDAELSYDLTGKLYKSRSGWLLLSVPNALGRGAFDALNAPGAELPVSETTGQYNAHISIMRPEEVAKIPGGADAVTERGHELTYTLGPIRTVKPDGWPEVSQVWFIEIRSPELEKLRKSYGLSALPNNNEYKFHCTFAVRKKSVLHPNEKSKAASLIHRPPTQVKAASTSYAIQPSGIHGQGVFATRKFEAGDVIGSAMVADPAVPNYRRSELGKYTNHSAAPNTVLLQDEDRYNLVADQDISSGAEITCDYHEAYKLLGDDARFEDGGGKDAFLKTASGASTALPKIDWGERLKKLEARRNIPEEKRKETENRGPKGEYCPHCDARLEYDTYDEKCNHCGAEYPPEKLASSRAFSHTHTRNDGTYDVAQLIQLMTERAPETLDLAAVRGADRSKRTGFSQKRMQQADTQYPGIVDQENKLVDGRHRLLKLLDAGESQGQFYRATPEDMAAVKLAADDDEHHHLRNECPQCGNVDTCRCMAPKVTTHNLCYECQQAKQADLKADIAAAAADCETPKSEEQASAGNYRHGHCTLHGLPITIETGKGMTRSGTSKAGKKWSITLAHHYGYIKRTESEADGDHIDVFIGDEPESEQVFIVDQVDPATGDFDEHKIMLGFTDEKSAKAGYLACYEKGWQGLSAISELTLAEFKKWTTDGDTGKPFHTAVAATKKAVGDSAAKQAGCANPAGADHAHSRGSAVRQWWLSEITGDVGGGGLDAAQSTGRGESRSKRADLLPGVQLQPQQSRVADQAKRERVRKLLYHSLGSGKTLASIATAEAAGEPYVATVPASLRVNFRGEQERFTDQQLPSQVQSYNALAKAPPAGPTGTAIFDEAHRLRNPESKQTQNAKQLASQAQNLVLLSGSPIVNHPSDLAPLIEMLTQQKMDPATFTSQFVGERTVKPGLWGRLQGVQPVQEPTIKNRDALKQLLAGKVDYHQPKEPGVEQLEERHTVPMSGEQQKLYQAFWDQLPWLLRWKLQHEFPLSKQEIANLSSFLSGPRQVGLSTLPFMKGRRNPMQAFQQSPKLQKAMELLEQTTQDPNAKVVAFSNFLEAGLEPYSAALTKKKIPHAMFHGGLSDGQRKQIVKDYNVGKLRALLLGPSGSEGISLKGTTALQLLDPHWNEARTDQAIGRGIRFDSHTHLPEDQRKVRVQRFISELPPGLAARVWRRLIQTKPSTKVNDPGTDTYLENMAQRKSQLNDQFLDVLREVGAPAEPPEEKQASVLDELRQAKQHSDARRYEAKTAILRRLMESDPEAWMIDQPRGPYPGVTHKPTNFRLHMARLAIPEPVARSGSFYGDALATTPVNIDPSQGILGNVSQHLGRVKARGDRTISEAGAADALQNAQDPSRAMSRMQTYLSGDRAPLVSHPIDRALHG